MLYEIKPLEWHYSEQAVDNLVFPRWDAECDALGFSYMFRKLDEGQWEWGVLDSGDNYSTTVEKSSEAAKAECESHHRRAMERGLTLVKPPVAPIELPEQIAGRPYRIVHSERFDFWLIQEICDEDCPCTLTKAGEWNPVLSDTWPSREAAENFIRGLNDPV